MTESVIPPLRHQGRGPSATGTGKPSLPTAFKGFIRRGNPIDPAVTVVASAAFTSIANPMVKAASNPRLGAFVTKDLAGYSSCLKGPCEINGKGEMISGFRMLLLRDTGDRDARVAPCGGSGN
jgi:hypothetical protein